MTSAVIPWRGALGMARLTTSSLVEQLGVVAPILKPDKDRSKRLFVTIHAAVMVQVVVGKNLTS